MRSEPIFVPVEDAPDPTTATGLVSRLGIWDRSHAEQRAAIATWLRDHEPSPLLARTLRSQGLHPDT